MTEEMNRQACAAGRAFEIRGCFILSNGDEKFSALA